MCRSIYWKFLLYSCCFFLLYKYAICGNMSNLTNILLFSRIGHNWGDFARNILELVKLSLSSPNFNCVVGFIYCHLFPVLVFWGCYCCPCCFGFPSPIFVDLILFFEYVELLEVKNKQKDIFREGWSFPYAFHPSLPMPWMEPASFFPSLSLECFFLLAKRSSFFFVVGKEMLDVL